LGSDDIASIIENAFLTRPLEWQEWVLWLLEAYPYFQSRNLKGVEGIIKFYTAWNLAADELFRRYPYSKVELRNPHDDWHAAIEKLNKVLDIV
jgi:hypothetical protein